MDKKQLKAKYRQQTLKLMKRYWVLYLFLLPATIYIILFCYGPMYGLQIAFRDYKISKGFFDSTWVGWKWFTTFFETPRFWEILWNTLRVSIYSMIVGFPFPVILAICLNLTKNAKWKKFAQTVTYMPHFISTVVLVGMINIMFSPDTGVVNNVIETLGGTQLYFMGVADYFPHMYVWSGVWQGIGWGSIIYMAALAGVDPSLHEAAMIDGANVFKRVLHIDLPTIKPTICIMLIMNCGSLLNVGYEKVYLMQNNLNITKAEVISTYVYKMGLESKRFSYSSAIGLFNNVVSFIFLVAVNKIVKKLTDTGLF